MGSFKMIPHYSVSTLQRLESLRVHSFVEDLIKRYSKFSSLTGEGGASRLNCLPAAKLSQFGLWTGSGSCEFQEIACVLEFTIISSHAHYAILQSFLVRAEFRRHKLVRFFHERHMTSSHYNPSCLQ